MITMPIHMLGVMLNMAAEAGATTAISKAGLQLSTMCKEEACRAYTRRRVERWIREGKLKKNKKDKWDIDRTYIELLYKTESNPSLALIKQL